MKRLLVCVCGLLLLWVMPARAAVPAPFPVQVTDARGVAVTLAHAPRRIVSLAPATTEMLFALGLGAFVVGDTVYCDYPPAARSVAKIGDVNVSYERVLALKPDLVVASDANGRAATRLSGLGVTTFQVAPTSWAGTENALRLLGKLTGRDTEAQALVADMERQAREAARLAREDKQPRPHVLFVLSAKPLWTAGRGTFLDDLIVRTGGVNAAGSIHGYAAYSPEAVVARPLDIVVADPQTRGELLRSPALSQLPAVRAGRFFYPADPNVLMRPGPRLGQGLLLLAHALHPGAK